MPPKIKITVQDNRDLITLRKSLSPLFRGQVEIKKSAKVPAGAEEVKGRDSGGTKP